MDPDQQRRALEALIAAHGASLAELSRVLGRNPAYLQQYLARGTPRLLPEAERGRLARFLGVPESAIGGPDAPSGMIDVARIDVTASAGAGGVVGEEARRRSLPFPPEQLRQLGVRAAAASVIEVVGDSMVPTLQHGDAILVDRDRRRVERQGGVFVLRLDDMLMVKRLRLALGGVEVVSDNPAYPARVAPAAAIDVVGRVVWMSRAL